MGIPISSIVETLLPILGKIGKGKATVVGTGTIATATAVAAAMPEDAVGALAVINALVPFLQALGALLLAFGVGRKAGATIPK